MVFIQLEPELDLGRHGLYAELDALLQSHRPPALAFRHIEQTALGSQIRLKHHRQLISLGLFTFNNGISNEI